MHHDKAAFPMQEPLRHGDFRARGQVQGTRFSSVDGARWPGRLDRRLLTALSPTSARQKAEAARATIACRTA